MFHGHHLIKHHRKFRSRNDSLAFFVDKLVYVGSIVGPIMTLPQLKNIWLDHNAAGVSAFSWGAYALVSLLWLFYGILHKVKPVIVMNALWVIIDILIVIGTIMYA